MTRLCRLCKEYPYPAREHTTLAAPVVRPATQIAHSTNLEARFMATRLPLRLLIFETVYYIHSHWQKMAIYCHRFESQIRNIDTSPDYTRSAQTDKSTHTQIPTVNTELFEGLKAPRSQTDRREPFLYTGPIGLYAKKSGETQFRHKIHTKFVKLSQALSL